MSETTFQRKSIDVKRNQICQIPLSDVWFISFTWRSFQSPQISRDVIH